ncbi:MULTISPECIES: hypothetical protein [Sneathiella]|jgi:hypothetical protein|uniref:hypothetical protein n=1 Tax=Sneathiella TaxID=510690 RepID=UPI00146CB8D2|nr:hypothetical protein [Sneathiella aquimaris]
MDYPIKNVDDLSIDALGITLDDQGRFDILIKDYSHSLTGGELLEEMKDQLDVRGSVRNALLRKAQKEILSGIKRGRYRMDEEQLETFDLNILIWFADKSLKGEHIPYLVQK